MSVSVVFAHPESHLVTVAPVQVPAVFPQQESPHQHRQEEPQQTQITPRPQLVFELGVGIKRRLSWKSLKSQSKTFRSRSQCSPRKQQHDRAEDEHNSIQSVNSADRRRLVKRLFEDHRLVTHPFARQQFQRTHQ